jgi:hypothetical protein
MQEEPIIDFDRSELQRAVGEGIEAYAEVENTLASILQELLRLELLDAHAIFYSVQNTRARLELFDFLLPSDPSTAPEDHSTQAPASIIASVGSQGKTAFLGAERQDGNWPLEGRPKD